MSNNKPILLVVDDESDILEALTLLLQDEGYMIVTDKGNHVEQKVVDAKPDLVLLDVLLEGRNGGEIAKHLKENKQTAKVPIVLMSAHPHAEKIIQENKADGFLAKPFEIEEIVAEVKKFIG